MPTNRNTTLGVIIGNRDFFPDKLVGEARAEILSLFKKLNITPVLLNETDSKLGGVETFAEAKKCAALFKEHADEIDWILVVLPNFGDEKGVAETIKISGLNVPVLIQAYPDDLGKMDVVNRREDSKLSLKELMADGGITSNKVVIQFLADLLKKPVATISIPDVSALGAAYLAGLRTGIYESIEVLKKLNSDKKSYLPGPDLSKVNEGYAGWQKTINKQ